MKLIIDVKQAGGGRMRLPISIVDDDVITRHLRKAAERMEFLIDDGTMMGGFEQMMIDYKLSGSDDVEIYAYVPIKEVIEG